MANAVTNEYYDTFMELWRDKFLSTFGTKPPYLITEEEKAFPVALIDSMLLACACGADNLKPTSISQQASLFFVRRGFPEGFDIYSNYAQCFIYSIQDALHDEHKLDIIRRTRLPQNPYVEEYETYVIFALDVSVHICLNNVEQFSSLPYSVGDDDEHRVYRFLSDALSDYCRHVERIVEQQEQAPAVPPPSKMNASTPPQPKPKEHLLPGWFWAIIFIVFLYILMVARK